MIDDRSWLQSAEARASKEAKFNFDDYIDNYGGENHSFMQSTRLSREINKLNFCSVRDRDVLCLPARYYSMEPYEIAAPNRGVECNKIEFQGIFSHINIYFSDTCYFNRGRGFSPLLRRIVEELWVPEQKALDL